MKSIVCGFGFLNWDIFVAGECNWVIANEIDLSVGPKIYCFVENWIEGVIINWKFQINKKFVN